MSLSPTQSASRDEDFSSNIDAAKQRSHAAVQDVWSRFAPNAGSPSRENQFEIFKDLGRAQPTNIDERISSLRQSGAGYVTDPEGRTGDPVFIAGTSPTGQNIPLDQGSLARLGDSLAYLYPVSEPGAPWGGTAYASGPTRAAESNTSILLNMAENSLGKHPAEVLAHETGHTINNYLGTADAPLAGANDAAMREFASMSAGRAAETNARAGSSIADYRYMNSGREQFAEGIRQYLTDPNGFKARYPEAAKYLRGVVNTNPKMNRLLMLSQDASTGDAYG